MLRDVEITVRLSALADLIEVGAIHELPLLRLVND
jgi:hypothetical protein